jgi:hypothetical protein
MCVRSLWSRRSILVALDRRLDLMTMYPDDPELRDAPDIASVSGEGEHLVVADDALAASVGHETTADEASCWIFVANLNLWIWLDNRPSPWACVRRDHITRMKKSWFTVPRIRHVTITTSTHGNLRLMAGKQFYNQLRDELGLTP